MKSQANQSPLTLQLTLTVLALAAFALVTVVGFATFATMRADDVALQRQKAFVAKGIDDAVAELMREQESVTVWDDAVTATRDHDEQWMRENVGEWMYSYYGHDRAFVLDERDEPVYAMADGKTVPPASYAEAEPAVAPQVARLRSLIADIAASDDPDPPRKVAHDIVSLGGRPAILSVMPFVPSSTRLEVQPGTEYLHVAAKFVDDQVIGAIARQYLLTDAHLSPLTSKTSSGSVPLVDSRGLIRGYVTWIPDRPGMTLIRETSLALIAGGLLALGVLAFLLRRLRRASSALHDSQNQAQFLAFHDTLTGLPNRALFEDRLQRAFVSARRNRSKVALLYIDLDRFKHVNDTLGHPAGDELVRQTARRLESRIREVDTVARLGGDEFAVIMVDTKNVHAAEKLSDEVLQALTAPFDLHGDKAFVGASIGIAVSQDADSHPDDLLRRADIALYEAKRKGRGRYEVFAGNMDDLLARRRLIEDDLRAALASDTSLELVYQPVFAAGGGPVLGAEALIRWDHPVHAALPPASFLAIAEERGFVGQLGSWMVARAVRFAAESGLPWVAVNLSLPQLREDGFAEGLLEILAAAGLPPHRLHVEIPESVLIDDNAAVVRRLEMLRSAGVLVVLDGFGTGFSSIGHLRRSPVDKVKIDASFAGEAVHGDEMRAVLEAIVRLAEALKLPVVAGGVEASGQRDILAAAGCAELQGPLLCGPIGSAELKARMSASLPSSATRASAV